jgi:phage-related protein
MTSFKKISAHFYASANGEEPVRTWLKTLSVDDRKSIGKDIQKVEYGWPIGLPVCRSLGGGLWEVRSDLSDGRAARVLFGFAHGTMVLLHGFVKKTQKTPQQDRELALRRLRALSKNEEK